MKELRTDYDVILLGCSCYAMGRAAGAPDKCLIIESGEGLGGEFIDALRAGDRPVERPLGDGAAFYDELISRGIMDECSAAHGGVHLPAVNVVLNRMALERGLNILFRARVFGIRRVQQGYELDAVCNAQTYVFTCRRLVDTRSTDFARIRRLDPDAQFALSANMHIEGEVPSTMGAFKLSRGYLPGEVYAHYAVEQPASGDRERLLSAFEARRQCGLAQGCSQLRTHMRFGQSRCVNRRISVNMYPDADFQIRLRLGPQGLQRGYSDGRYISLAAG